MEIKVGIELTGDPEEVGSLLAQLADVLAGEELGQLADDVNDWWTDERAAALARELTDPSLRALAIIADLAPKATFAEVRKRMARVGPPLSPGHLSSIGFAVRRLDYPFPPFLRDYYQRTYLMDEGVAKILSVALVKEFERRGLT